MYGRLRQCLQYLRRETGTKRAATAQYHSLVYAVKCWSISSSVMSWDTWTGTTSLLTASMDSEGGGVVNPNS
ncbi:hypothetical protein DPMN_007106 [Dreissena polymorpha]|uniref:Uncharacterized protein n=1 Tax=Dreissena polymorpha TaxID=45954 RepID=A0A9D4RVN5_DREPO|nr:hypothetical protein DPMN_007106 [Dreissena polymorpha]